MDVNVLIVHYNTPRLLDACIRSVKKTTPGAKIFVFENSDKKPWKNHYDDVTIFDNSKGQIIDFKAWLDGFKNKKTVANDWGSAKHCYTIEKCFDLIPDGFILLDSDVLVKRDLTGLWDEECYWVGEKDKQWNGKMRVVPFVCYINVKKCKENAVHYYDERHMHGLHAEDRDDNDTGAFFLKGTEKLLHKEIKGGDFIEHYRSGSWGRELQGKFHNFMQPVEWLMKHKNLWIDNSIVRGDDTLLCCIVKMENHYIGEWVDYYKSIGIDKIIIYDNNFSKGDYAETVIDVDEVWEGVVDGFIDVIPVLDEAAVQCKYYTECYKQRSKEYKWLCFFDVDEYLHFETCKNIHEYLGQEKFNGYDLIHINWKCFDDNDLITVKDGNYSLQKRFTRETAKHDWAKGNRNLELKSIVRGGLDGLEFRSNPHTPNSKDFSCCNADGSKGDSKRSATNRIVYEGAWLNHYITKTLEEYIDIKGKRGGGVTKDGLKYNIEYFFRYNDRTPEKEEYIRSRGINSYGTVLTLSRVVTATVASSQIKPSKPQFMFNKIEKKNCIRRIVNWTNQRPI